MRAINFNRVRQHKEDPDRRILDVRRASEYEEGHLEGAINKAHTRLLKTGEQLSREYTYMVHCQSGSRAAAAAALLKSKGYEVEWVDDNFNNIDAGLIQHTSQKNVEPEPEKN
jgi:hydroxyacylglutathione hydrolase